MTPIDWSIAEMGARLRDRTLTSAALTEAHLERIGRLNAELHAFVLVRHEAALASARQADHELAQGHDRGPLHGIPVAVKDLIDVAGMPTSCGSRVRHGAAADAHAEVVRRLVDGGAVILGKLATYEFALVGPSFDLPTPPALNPWNPDHVTGGSSSGSASAVAAGMVRSAIGTDTGGSVRSPACYCGVVGLKPTHGCVPTRGVFPLAPSLDHIGPLSASVEEAALTLDVIADANKAEEGCRRSTGRATSRIGRPLDEMRIGYARSWFASDPLLMPGVLRAMDDAVSQLSLLGARIEEVTLPDYAVMEAAGAIILHAEALDIHQSAMQAQAACYGRSAFQSLAAGAILSSDDVIAARKAAHTLRTLIDTNHLSCVDVIVTASTLTTAPPVSAFQDGKVTWTPMRTLPFNVTGHPSLAVPIGFAGGLPMGMQIVGRWYDEATICQVGHAFERSTGHSAERPPLL